MHHKKLIILLMVALSGSAPIGQANLKPPKTAQIPVSNAYHGVEVNDPYQWLEDRDNLNVQSWSNEQNTYTRHILDNLPYVDRLHNRISKILTATSIGYSALSWRKGMLFAIKRQPLLEQPLLVSMPSAEEPQAERVIVDLYKVDPNGSTTIDFYVPSPDGRLVAVSLSAGGSESGDIHIFDTSTGKELGLKYRQ